MLIARTARHLIAERRIQKVLTRLTVANMRTLEQKISDSGPNDLRIDPHILTEARNFLTKQGILRQMFRGQTTWYYLASVDKAQLDPRLTLLNGLHVQTKRQNFIMRVGQALEIATYRALLEQSQLTFFGGFADLDDHDDSTLYRKVEPPSTISGKSTPSGKNLDFLVQHESGVLAGLELKNVREWFYPDRAEVRELLLKCCALNIVPVLIARRIHFSTFALLNPCGVITHETYNQLYPLSDLTLAERSKDKDLLGYHDIRVGNIPDERLKLFVGTNLPNLIPKARILFDEMKDLLEEYATQRLDYETFRDEVKSRLDS